MKESAALYSTIEDKKHFNTEHSVLQLNAQNRKVCVICSTNIWTLPDGLRRLVSGVNHSQVAVTALLHVPSARRAPNHRGPVKDGEAAHSSPHNTAQGNQ